MTIVNCSTVRCVQSYQGNAMPLVNAASSRRMILRMMRRERHRGSQLSRRADEPTQSSGISLRCLGLRSMPCPVGAGRMRSVALAVRAREARPLGGETALVDFIVWLITPEW